MQELFRLLRETGGLELEIREHGLWRALQGFKEKGPLKNVGILGQFQIIASSDLGKISVIQSADVMTNKLRFEIYRLKSGTGDDDGDTDYYWDRRACCRRVCRLLAPVSYQVVKRWREKHGKPSRI